MKNTTKIYGLVSTREPSNIRYIGKTINQLYQRRYEHQKESLNYEFNTWKCRWIRKEIAEGFKLKIILIDEVWNSDWDFWEMYYIAEYRRRGYKLTNITPGGDSPYNTSNSRSIVVLKRSGGYVNTFESIRETCRHLNISVKLVEKCLYSTSKSTGGYQFIYKEDYNVNKNYNLIKSPKKYIPVPKEQRLLSWRKNSLKSAIKNQKSIAAYDKEGKLFKIWSCRKDAAKELGGNTPKGINKALYGEKPRWRGYTWKLV